MILFDVNVLVYAYRDACPQHQLYRARLEETINNDEPFGVSDLVLSGFLRIVTNPRVFSPPTPIQDAVGFVRSLRSAPNFLAINPGARHWDIFLQLCLRVGAKGNLVPDAYLAAIAIEAGADWLSSDRDYSRFPGLRWRHPLD